MPAVLGVDGGGTKTHVVVADHMGEVLGAAVDGPSNWEDVGPAAAAATISAAADVALGHAGLDRADLAASTFGLAGVDWPSDVERLEAVIGQLGFGGPRRIMNDSFIALRAGSSHPWGVVLISGTGTIAAGRNAAGEEFRTLGLGPMFGDWGGVVDVSEAAVRAVADQYTGRGPSTILTELLCERDGVDTAGELLERISRPATTPIDPQAENVAPLVLAATERGDLVARDILERVGHALGESAALVARRLSMQQEEFELVLAGKLFRTPNRYLDDALETRVIRVAPGAAMARLEAPPVLGALLTAMELGGPEVRVGLGPRLASAVERAIRDAVVV